MKVEVEMYPDLLALASTGAIRCSVCGSTLSLSDPAVWKRVLEIRNCPIVTGKQDFTVY